MSPHAVRAAPGAGAYLLGMCEGNHCVGGTEGKDAGNGRIVVARQFYYEDGSCE